LASGSSEIAKERAFESFIPILLQCPLGCRSLPKERIEDEWERIYSYIPDRHQGNFRAFPLTWIGNRHQSADIFIPRTALSYCIIKV
jgi:hypothetical protein